MGFNYDSAGHDLITNSDSLLVYTSQLFGDCVCGEGLGYFIIFRLALSYVVLASKILGNESTKL